MGGTIGGLRQKVYLKDSGLNVSPKRRSLNANIGSTKEIHSAESQAAHENMPRLWKQKRSDSDEMPQMPQQKPAVEEERTRKVRNVFLV